MDTKYMELRFLNIRRLLALPLVILALQACAQDSAEVSAEVEEAAAPDAAVTSNLPEEYAFVQEALPGVVVSKVGPSPVVGLLEVYVGADVFYVTEDGKYFVQGEVFDMDSRVNVTDQARKTVRADYLQEFSEDSAVSFPAADEKFRVMVFTDIDCPYCRKLHREMEGYHAEGITVEYLFFPRSGPGTPSWAKAEAVWCAESRQAAMTQAKEGEVLDAGQCTETPVAEHYKLGKDLGISGTPAIVTESGDVITGYRSPAELIQALEALDEAGST